MNFCIPSDSSNFVFIIYFNVTSYILCKLKKQKHNVVTYDYIIFL